MFKTVREPMATQKQMREKAKMFEKQCWYDNLQPNDLRKVFVKSARKVFSLRDNLATAEKELQTIQLFIATKFREVRKTDDLTKPGLTLWHLTEEELARKSSYVKSDEKDKLFYEICERLTDPAKKEKRIPYIVIKDMLTRNRFVDWGKTRKQWKQFLQS
jgi:hypothetical protein